MQYAASYQDIIDHAGEAADKMDRAIRALEADAREECAAFFTYNVNDVWEDITEHPAVSDAVAFAANSIDATEIGSKMIRAMAMARIKFVNEHWTGWARWSIQHAINNGDHSWPSIRRDYLDAIALGGEL